MRFMVIYHWLFHIAGCSALNDSYMDILPTAAFRSQGSRHESPQVEFGTPNIPTVKQAPFVASVTDAHFTAGRIAKFRCRNRRTRLGANPGAQSPLV
jgi:hypothetical protein